MVNDVLRVLVVLLSIVVLIFQTSWSEVIIGLILYRGIKVFFGDSVLSTCRQRWSCILFWVVLSIEPQRMNALLSRVLKGLS